MVTVESLLELYNYAPNPGEMVYVKGFWDKNDGGGGFFIFDEQSTLNPFFNDASYFKIGFNVNYDGMVCKSISSTTGRWIRQWDRGKLNLRWFGAVPDWAPVKDTSKALNAALEYAQFTSKSDSSATIFDNYLYTRPGKTIFIPTGRYKFHSAISSIYYGVVIEGEGNMGTSSHGTRLLILHEYTKDDEAITGEERDHYGFFRYYANMANNSGGGINNLTIDIASNYNSNVILLVSKDKLTPSQKKPEDKNAINYNSAVSKWKAENIVLSMRGKALRAIYMRSYQEGGVLPWRIRDTSIINCWFAGASIEGQTVSACNASGLQIVGGFFSSGLGVGINPIQPGLFLWGKHGCANVHLNGLDLTYGYIKIHKKSTLINVNCRFGMLLIYNREDKSHKDLRVTKYYTLNLEGNTNKIPNTSQNLNSQEGYLSYRNTGEIENDILSNQDNLNDSKATGSWLS